MAAELTRHDLEAKIVKRCWEDEAFRKEFTSDPAAAFAKHTDVPRAQLPRIVVHEEPAGSWHIVLPAKPANAAELSDDELEAVAGGLTPTMLTYAVAISLIAASVSASASGIATATAAVTMNKGW